MSTQSYQSMVVEPVATDLRAKLGHRDHSVSGQWHLHGPPKHLTKDSMEAVLVAPHAKEISEELILFMEEYYWRVDNGTQEELWKAMFTPSGMYYNNGFKMITHGFADAALVDSMFEAPWLKHQMDRVCILPTWNAATTDNGSVLVHVLGSHWNGKKMTKDRKAQERIEALYWPFSQTFEIIKFEGVWKINRVLLMMHDNLMGLKGDIGK